jgi:hypothetical protein
MKSFVFALALSTLALPAFAERDYNPYPNYGEQEALRTAQYQNQQYIERLIRREIERRKAQSRRSSSRSSTANCGKSYWTKREALNYCPPATAMKVRQDGEVFYHCDCE